MDLNGNKIIAVDFDGTLSLGVRWPEVGEPNERLINYLKKEKAAGTRIILWTCRHGEALDAAVAWCAEQGLEFDTINENLPELIELWGETRKVSADMYIDDRTVNPFRNVMPY